MKKISISMAFAIILTGIMGFGVLKFFNKEENSNIPKNAEVSWEKAVEASTKKIEGLEFAQTVPADASEEAVLGLMHKMTHQKIIASEKWGIIRMDEEAIAKAKQILLASDFNSKEDLLEIIERWENGHFDQVDDDHNFIWNLQGGSIGLATGILSEQQEQQFIDNNFTD